MAPINISPFMVHEFLLPLLARVFCYYFDLGTHLQQTAPFLQQTASLFQLYISVFSCSQEISIISLILSQIAIRIRCEVFNTLYDDKLNTKPFAAKVTSSLI
jgi:hypothetical protein